MSFKIFYTGKTKRDSWECYSWSIHLGDQTFVYYTGLGHAKKSNSYLGTKPKEIQNKATIRTTENDSIVFVYIPKLRDVLHSLVLDASSANDTFENFCSEFGYDTDSRKALDIYLKCQENAKKLNKVMKSKNYIERIQSWNI